MNCTRARLLTLFICVSISMGASEDTYIKEYLDAYAPIAIAEMDRAGIPASIKLAQGMLESNWGRSELANRANNHFGIKCGGSWRGGEYYREDDDRGRNGKIIPSCFRRYQDAAQSYIAHSDFLSDSKKTNRYGFLFELDPTDYKSWAKGLKKAGYATDPKYPNKLISIIEKYELHQYDRQNTEVLEMASVSKSKVKTKPVDKKAQTESQKSDRIKLTSLQKKISKKRKLTKGKVNGVPCWKIGAEITVEALAFNVGMSIDNICKYNDNVSMGTDSLQSGDRIYVKAKKRDYKGKEDIHLVQPNESIESIAQLYGVKVATLRYLNRIARSATPIEGETITLKKKNKMRPATKRNERKTTLDF